MKNVLEIRLRATSVSNSLGLMFPEWQIAVILLHSFYRDFSFLSSYHSRHHFVRRCRLFIAPLLHQGFSLNIKEIKTISSCI
jgi:hypothetical protein